MRHLTNAQGSVTEPLREKKPAPGKTKKTKGKGSYDTPGEKKQPFG